MKKLREAFAVLTQGVEITCYDANERLGARKQTRIVWIVSEIHIDIIKNFNYFDLHVSMTVCMMFLIITCYIYILCIFVQLLLSLSLLRSLKYLNYNCALCVIVCLPMKY